MEIRNLAKEGVPIARIAELLGRDWKTVAKAAKAEHKSHYVRTQKKPSKLEPYQGFIQAKLQEASYTVPRLLEMLNIQGYCGGHTLLYYYVAQFKREQYSKAVLRFETLPGQQMQADWAEFAWVELPDGSLKKLYMFGAILGYSRMRYIEFTFDCKLERLLLCLRHAFEYFGGVSREILFDNMKTVTLGRDLREGTIRFHPKFLDFAGYYGFTPRLTWPYRAQTKGKVERTIGYVRQDFWPGIRFENLQDLNIQALAWCEKVNGRTHSQTQEVPMERLAKENLTSIAGRAAYDTRVHVLRRASRDCWVYLEGNFYSIPWKYAGRDVTVLSGEHSVEIFLGSEKIAHHPKAQGKGNKIHDPAHFKGLRAKAVSEAKRGAIRKLPVISLKHSFEAQSWPSVEVRPAAAYDVLVIIDGACAANGTGGAS